MPTLYGEPENHIWIFNDDIRPEYCAVLAGKNL